MCSIFLFGLVCMDIGTIQFYFHFLNLFGANFQLHFQGNKCSFQGIKYSEVKPETKLKEKYKVFKQQNQFLY